MLRILKANEQNDLVQSYDYPLDFTEEEVEPDIEDDDKQSKDEIELDARIVQRPMLSDAFKKESASAVNEVKKMADEILEEAKKKAAKLMEEARQEGLKSGYETGYKEGTEKGYEEAYKQHKEEMGTVCKNFLQEMKKLIEEATDKKDEMLDKNYCQLRDVAIAVAEKVIHVSLKSSGKIIEKMILSATDKIRNKQWAKIYIAKCDAEMVLKGDTDILKALSHVSDRIKIIVMDNESMGTCIIELPDEIIDASVNTQVENIKEILNSTSM